MINCGLNLLGTTRLLRTPWRETLHSQSKIDLRVFCHVDVLLSEGDADLREVMGVKLGLSQSHCNLLVCGRIKRHARAPAGRFRAPHHRDYDKSPWLLHIKQSLIDVKTR